MLGHLFFVCVTKQMLHRYNEIGADGCKAVAVELANGHKSHNLKELNLS